MKASRFLAGAFIALGLTLGACETMEQTPIFTPETVSDATMAGFEVSIPTGDASTVVEENGFFSANAPATDRQRSPLEALRCFVTELTAEQRQQIETILQGSRECSKTIIDSLRIVERQIVSGYNEQIRALRQQAINGEITREQFRAAVDSLRAEVRNALVNSPARAAAREALAACRTSMMEAIRSVLTPEQQAKWDDCVNNGNCCTPVRPPKDSTGRRPDDRKPNDDSTRRPDDRKPADDRGGRGRG